MSQIFLFRSSKDYKGLSNNNKKGSAALQFCNNYAVLYETALSHALSRYRCNCNEPYCEVRLDPCEVRSYVNLSNTDIRKSKRAASCIMPCCALFGLDFVLCNCPHQILFKAHVCIWHQVVHSVQACLLFRVKSTVTEKSLLIKRWTHSFKQKQAQIIENQK